MFIPFFLSLRCIQNYPSFNSVPNCSSLNVRLEKVVYNVILSLWLRCTIYFGACVSVELAAPILTHLMVQLSVPDDGGNFPSCPKLCNFRS
jgi:hypothetical protein